jgi:hypothetical protein
LRPNKDAAWKLCEIGDVQDCEKTLAFHFHETGLIENRGDQDATKRTTRSFSRVLQPGWRASFFFKIAQADGFAQ